jgi:signal peptidase I
MRQNRWTVIGLQSRSKQLMMPTEAVMSESHAIKSELAVDVLRSSGELRLQVEGWSMLPSIWPGDVLIVKRVDFSKVAEGEIVLFRRNRRLFAHRVVRSEGSDIVTRGDSMAAPDSPVEKDEIMGRVSSIIRRGKSLQPRTSLRIGERVIADLVQRSEFAARLLVRASELMQA